MQKWILPALVAIAGMPAEARSLLDKPCVAIGLYLDDPELFAQPVAVYFDAALDVFTAGKTNDERRTMIFALIDACESDMGQSIGEAMGSARKGK